MKVTVLQSWLMQVLRGLQFLHTMDPPVIHRDLRCDNIFIRTNVGTLKIGGLELGIFMRASHPAEFGGTRKQSLPPKQNKDLTYFIILSGTPGYMPVDLASENFPPKSDIYAFGMCVLEMFTFKLPYEECKNSYQIFAKQLNVRRFF